jgi:hypothetical protein
MADTANEQRSPEEIRHDIEETRGDLGDTVEALAAKADVKAQAQERVDGVKQKVADVTPAGVQQTAKEKPLPFVAGGALLVGFLLGRVSARG